MKLPLIYFDNSATTVPCKETVESINFSLKNNWGNPSSTHKKGVDALVSLASAKETVASSIGCKAEEIIFTSCGTEANNLAIIGAAQSKKRQGNRIISTTIEHPSVLKALEFLESEGFEIIKLSPDNNGFVSPEKFKEVVNNNTILVSVMLVNNETGSIQNIPEIAKIVKANSSAVLHCDAVQGYGKLPIKTSVLGVDLLSASGHKIHASKGIGFLYKSKKVNLVPIMHGGGQENGLRSGTESMPLIEGFVSAIKVMPDINKQLNITSELFKYAKEKLRNTNLVKFNSPENCLPYILNISVEGYKAEPLLNAFSMQDIFLSKGSACAKGQRSYVLKECGLDNDRIDSALRISFSRYNTKEEIDIFIDTLINITNRLRRFK